MMHLVILFALMALCKPDETVFMAKAYAVNQGTEASGEWKGVPCAAEDSDGVLNDMGDEERGPVAATIGASAEE